jgi:protein SCO1/2
MIRLAALLVLFATPALALDPFAATGIDRPDGATLPLDGTLRDHPGDPVTLAGLADGRPILLVPVLHECPNICGVTLSGLAQAMLPQPSRPGRDFTLVAFGIDPAETPADARTARDRLAAGFPQLDPTALHARTGTAAEIAAVTDALGYRYAWDPEIGQYAHVAAAAVLTHDGRLTAWLYGIAPDPTDLKLALTEAGEGRIGTWTDQLLLLCYHYDPVTGRYGSLVTGLLRAAGAATAGGGALLIGIALFRERRRPR